jgi:hypothetical protein
MYFDHHLEFSSCLSGVYKGEILAVKLVYTTVEVFWALIYIYGSMQDSSDVDLGFICHT